jgi:hypothetical protein
MDPSTPKPPAGAAVLTSDILRSLRDYWLGLRADGRATPAPEAVDPVAIPRLLPHVVLADVSHDPLRFRYRLIGTKVTALAGRDATGRWIDRNLYGDNTDRVLWAYRRCVETRAPVAVRESVQFVDKDWIVIEVLLMPLGGADDFVGRVLGGVDTVDHPKDAPLPDRRLELDWRA